ncbi:MAG: 30S ribosomal protein S2 [Verrucomicrobiota bacterium]
MATTGVVRSDVNVQDLLEAGLHFGHQTKRWNPKMKRYIFGERNGIYIIDLNQSLELLNKARQFVYDTVVRGRRVLFVGTKKQAQEPLKEIADRLHMPYVVNRWLGGTLTNNQTIRKSITRMRELEKLEHDGTMNTMPKKEVSRLRRELAKMQYNLTGIADMDQLPGAVFVIDICREAIAVAEANRLKIPVIAVVDTNADPDPIDYPIPGNDDAIRAVRLIVDSIGSTVQQASNEYARVAADETRRRLATEAEAAAKARAAEEERKAREAKEKVAREAKEKAARKAKAEAAPEKPADKPAEKPAKAEDKPKAPAAKKAKTTEAGIEPAAPATSAPAGGEVPPATPPA